MFNSIEEQQDFLNKYQISADEFRESFLSWDILREIAEDFDANRDEHLKTVQNYAILIQQCSAVHSLSFRVKDTEHLIAKVIKKNKKYLQQGKAITKDNYKQYITDLMGLRILLLFKEDWKEVHDYIVDNYEKNFIEKPFAYIREGDNKAYYDGIVEIREEKPYRSVHYTIRHSNDVGLEIQVRTLFEEAWGEIDHKIRYPYNMKHEMINGYLEIMNRAAGMADEMGSFINRYIKSFEIVNKSGIISDNDVYNYIIEKMSDCEDVDLKDDIISKIRLAEDYKKMSKLSDVMKDILKNI